MRKVWLFLKFTTSETGQKTITIRILLYISRSKGNQVMKFDQLIEHKMKNIFLEKLYTKCDGEASPTTFYKKIKIEHIFGLTV